MNKSQIIKTQGAVRYADRTYTEKTIAHVLDTDRLYRTSYGSMYAPRWARSVSKTCTANLREATGWLTLSVGYIGWSVDRKAKIAAAEEFIANFTGSVSDVLDAQGHLIPGALPSGVSLRVVASRELHAR